MAPLNDSLNERERQDGEPYVSTYLGNRFYFQDPRIDDVHIEDIAHGLAFQCRFNGQTRAFYSVVLQASKLVTSPLDAL